MYISPTSATGLGRPLPRNNSVKRSQLAMTGGHTFSPQLREQQAEVDELNASVPELAAQGKAELDRMLGDGMVRFEVGDMTGARECFVASYLMARELNFLGGEAEALNMAALCYCQLGDAETALQLFDGRIL